MFIILPDICKVISRKVVSVGCGRKIKNSWLNTFFFIKVKNYPMQKYWIHDPFFKFPIENLYFKNFKYSNF